MLFDIPCFISKRIEANYLKYLKASLESVGYFIPILNNIILKVCLCMDE